MDFVLRQVILYVLFTVYVFVRKYSSCYVELLLFIMEIVRRVRVHKHGSIDK